MSNVEKAIPQAHDQCARVKTTKHHRSWPFYTFFMDQISTVRLTGASWTKAFSRLLVQFRASSSRTKELDRFVAPGFQSNGAVNKLRN